MPRGFCHRHGQDRPCSCAMGNLYRFVEPVVLYLIKQKGSAYGYELGTALKEHALTDSVIDRAALYRTLQDLEKAGFVTSEWDVTGNGPARHLYRISPLGEEHLKEWAVVLEQLTISMQRFIADVKEIAGADKSMIMHNS